MMIAAEVPRHTTTDRAACAVCGQRPPAAGRVCDPCRDTIAGQLHHLIGQMNRLEAAVVPSGGRGDGVRVSASKPGGSPTPARLDVLSLIGPGAETVTAMMHPKIRHWRTVQDVVSRQVITRRRVVDGREVETAAVVVRMRQMTVWHRELDVDPATGRPYLADDDDQIGVLPPREWLALWVTDWQQTLGRSGPPAARFRARPQPPTGGFRSVALARLAADPAAAPLLAAMYAVRQAYDHAVQATLAGQTYGYAGDITRWDRTEDPLSDDLDARFGGAAAAPVSVTRSVTFLLLWLDEACAHPDVPIGDFAAELRAVVGELTRVLGEQPDLQWLGRCPARLENPDDGTVRPCGAGIWQDPHASQVQCPRCHATWGPRRSDLLRLAVDMRRTWPVDRRRRYTAEEIEQVRRPKCPTCGGLTDITWRDVTGVGDRHQSFQAVGAVCPDNGCDTARQVI